MKSVRFQVRVEPPPSALSMTLLAFAAERRHLLHGARSCRLISPADTSGPCNFAVYSKKCP